METEAAAPSSVKCFKKNRLLRPGNKRTVILFIRLLGYLRGVWVRSDGRIEYFIWDKRRFAACSNKPGAADPGYSVKHLERMFPKFQVWCTEYKFERVRLGRSHRVKVTRNLGVAGSVRGGEVRARLEGAIRSMVAKSGSAHVDEEFVRKFAGISKLPREAVAIAWEQLDKVTGMDCRWRGRGAGRKFVVFPQQKPAAGAVLEKTEKISGSDPQVSPGLSFPPGRRDEKQSAAEPAAPDLQTDRPPAAPTPKAQSDTANRVSAVENPSPDSNRFEARKSPSVSRGIAWEPPLQMCGRFVRSHRLRAKACWLTVDPIKKIHLDFYRVRWRFAHPFNFARHALREGYTADAILVAYRKGCYESHNDSLDMDKPIRDELGIPREPIREPSATVIYAWRELHRADNRPAEVRWAEFFAAPYVPYVRKPRAPKPAPGAAAAAAKTGLPPDPNLAPAAIASELVKDAEPGRRLDSQRPKRRVQELRDVIDDLLPRADRSAADSSASAPLTIPELKEFLAGRVGLTLGQFAALSWVHRTKLIERALASRKK